MHDFLEGILTKHFGLLMGHLKSAHGYGVVALNADLNHLNMEEMMERLKYLTIYLTKRQKCFACCHPLLDFNKNITNNIHCEILSR